MRDHEFIGYLKGLADRDDRAALAVLRRGASRSIKNRIAMYRYIANWVAEGDGHWNEECLYLIAALFASYPEAESTDGNFGESTRQLRLAKESESIERRFVALLAADTQALPNHIRYMVNLLKTENIPVNWLKLLRDLHRWKSSSRSVERAWARQFWRFVPKPEPDTETAKEHQRA